MKKLNFRKDLTSVKRELLRFAYKLTTDHEEENNLLQEISLKVSEKEDKHTSDTNLKGWMDTIMRNIFIYNYHKLIRNQTFIYQMNNLYHLSLPQDASYECAVNAYELKDIYRVVNTLPQEYKIPFALHLSGFKYQEIAAKLNLSPNTIKNRIYFIRQILQEELKDLS